MNMIKMAVVAIVTAIVSGMSLAVATAQEGAAKGGISTGTVKQEELKISNASQLIHAIAAIPNRKIPLEVVKEARAVVIVPMASKQAFMVKAGSNGGVLLVRDKAGAWSNPVFISISGGTLGWQIAGDPMDIILLFRNSGTADALLKGGKLTLDTKVDIVPGRVAPTMKGASHEELKAEVTSYVRSHGLFAEEAVVAGTTLRLDAAANSRFYIAPNVAAAEIVSGSAARSTKEVSALQRQLADYPASK